MRGLYCFALSTLCLMHSATGTDVRGIASDEQDMHTEAATAAATTTTESSRYLQNAFNAFKAPFFNNGILSTRNNECTYDPTDFETDLIVEFEGNPEDITDADLRVMEESFLTTFNDIAGGLCDSSFRTVKSVTISASEVVETRRRARELQGNSVGGIKLPPRRFSFRLFILGNCRRCVQESALFNDAFRRRGLQLTGSSITNGARFNGFFQDHRPMDIPTGSNRFFFKSPFNCDCETTATLGDDRSVGSEEFNAQYNGNLAKLNAEGTLPSVRGSLGVTEVEEVTCAADFDDFDSEVIVGANGDPERVSADELDLLTDLFLQSYRTTTNDLCDNEFRLLTGANVEVLFANGTTVSQTRRTLLEQTDEDVVERDLQTNRFRPFRFRFRVSGKCKGCKTEARLFDDAFRRRLAEEEQQAFADPSRSRRELAFVINNDTCFCAINAPDGLPATSDFSVNLNQALQTEQAAENTFPNVVAVMEVTQIDDTLPSGAPSLTPSIQPSDVPSASPSIQPSDVPSESPSKTPSISPSVRPSRPPSQRPSPTVPTESPVPSPQPSVTPTGDTT